MTATNTAEGYSTDPTNVTAANSGGASGTAFAVVSPSNTSAIVATQAAASHGSWGYRITPASGAVALTELRDGAGSAIFSVRGYLTMAALPSVTMSGPLHLRSTTDGNMCRLDCNASGQLLIQATATATTPLGLSAGTRYRFAWFGTGLNTTTGTQTLNIYAGESLTPFTTATLSGTANTTGLTDRVRFGKTATTAGTWGPLDFDSLIFDTAISTEIPPEVTATTLGGRQFIMINSRRLWHPGMEDTTRQFRVGAMSALIMVAGTASGATTATGAVSGAKGNTTTASGSTVAGGTVSGFLGTANGSSGTTTAGGTVVGSVGVSRTVAGATTAGGTVSGFVGLSGSASGATVAAGVPTGARGVSSSVSGATVADGVPSGNVAGAGGNVAGATSAGGSVAGTVNRSTTTAGVTTAGGTVSGSVTTGVNGSASGNTVAGGTLASTVGGVRTVAGDTIATAIISSLVAGSGNTAQATVAGAVIASVVGKRQSVASGIIAGGTVSGTVTTGLEARTAYIVDPGPYFDVTALGD